MGSVLRYDEVDMNQINYSKPEKVGTSYFGSLSYGEHLKPFYIQTPKVKSKINIKDIADKKIPYLDIEIPNGKFDIYDFFLNIDDKNIKTTFQKSQEWFNKELPLEAIDDMYKRSTKPFKKNENPTLRFRLPVVKNKIQCGVYNQQRVFVDINEYDLNINFEDLQKKYTKDCVAVIPVHVGGHPCEMEKIIPWAKKKKLLVIEDCAHTAGGIYRGKMLGTWGDISCFSFEEKKMLTTGDGGMICTNNKSLAEKFRSLSFHGWNRDPWSRHNKSLSKKNLKENLQEFSAKNNKKGNDGFKLILNRKTREINASNQSRKKQQKNTRTIKKR